MAVFGAPIAHEDHARRACYAALQMLDDVAEYAAELRRGPGLNFSVRIGINSGEVVAGAIGAGGEGEYTAIGHTVGLAQRMEALAEPGKAYLTESTAELAAGFLALEDLGEFEIKGASQPVRVFELAGVGAARSRLDLSRERGFSRFVGRDEEMATLRGGARRGRAQARAPSSAIVAEPGRRQEPPLPTSSPSAAASAASRSSRPRPSRTASRSPSCPSCRCCAPTSGSATATPTGSPARRSPAGRCCSTPSSPRSLPLLFDFLGVPDPDRPVAQMSAEARAAGAGRSRLPPVNAPDRRHAVVARGRGPALDGRGQRHDARRAGRLGRRDPHPRRRQLPPRILADWAARRSTAAISLEPLGAGGHRASCCATWPARTPRSTGSTELIHERTAGQPVLRRGDRPRAGRGRPPRGRARRLPAGRARSRTPASRPPCRRCSPPASTASAPTPSGCCRSPRCSARRSAPARSA